MKLFLLALVIAAIIFSVDAGWSWRRRRRHHRPKPRPVVRNNNGKCTIILYQHWHYKGRAKVLHCNTPSLPGFNDIASSAKVLRCTWRLCEHNNYGGLCRNIGPGSYRGWSRFPRGNDKLSSLRPYGARGCGGRPRPKPKPKHCGCSGCGHGVCSASGDPHFRTFDHKMIHFMGTCTYTLSKPLKVAGLTDFHVMIKGERRYGSKKVAYTKYLLVDVAGMRFKLDKGRIVYLNGQRVHLPISKAGVNVRLSGRMVEICTNFGLRVAFDGNHRSEVNVPAKYKGKMSGLCGNWNGNRNDDMKDSRGRIQRGYAAVGNSWFVRGVDVTCAHKEPEFWPKCAKAQSHVIRGNRYCGRLKTGPFRSCHRKVGYAKFVTNCYYDLCSLGVTKKVYCKSLESYSDECKSKGVAVNWRRWAGCPLPCAANSFYKFCTSACPNTCTNVNAARSCKNKCVEGCECRSGFVLSGRKCVPRSQCGCKYGGLYRQLGETWTDNTCNTKYTCKPGNKVVTISLGCKDGNSECRLNGGFWGCYCKTGFVPKNGRCQKQCPPLCRMACRAGFVKNADGCPICRCKPVPTPKPIKCQAGYHLDAKGVCIQIKEEIVYVCPKGTKKVGNECYDMSCPAGSKLEGGQCVTTEIVYEVECPAGYKQKGQLCVDKNGKPLEGGTYTEETVTNPKK